MSDQHASNATTDLAYKDYLRVRKVYFSLHLLCNLLRSFFLAFFIFGLWNAYLTVNWQENLLLLFTSFFGILYLSYERYGNPKSKEELIRSYEVKFPNSGLPIWAVGEDSDSNHISEWQENLSQFLGDLKSGENQRFRRLLSTLLIPFILCLIVLAPGIESVGQSFSNLTQYMTMINKKPRLQVLQGNPTEEQNQQKHFKLSPAKPVNLELLSPNLIEITAFSISQFKSPVVYLNQHGAKENVVYQTFKMNTVGNHRASSHDGIFQYRISFAVTNDVDILIPSLYGNNKLASVKVKKLPVPEVSLTALTGITEPWHDEKPLALKITAQTKAPMKMVQLLIRSGNHEARELVNRINSDQIFDYDTEYSLVLEPYINNDIADVEVIAEVVDSSIPRPLVGRSEPLRFRTESAYGRYRHTLRLLRELKSMVDDGVETEKYKLSEEASKLVKDAVKRSASTPFFDTLDRIQIHEFADQVEKISERDSFQSIFELQSGLNEFLVEHEILDDRERDRDFFVASRALSRLIEQPEEKRPVSVSTAVENLKSFLNNRRERWELRVAQLMNPGKLKDWEKIKNEKPFIKRFEKIEKEIADKKPDSVSSALSTLSQNAADYRKWIEDLEALEDSEREAKEQKRQEGLASARKQLRELQKRQGKISGDLDQAITKDSESLSDRWPMTRLKQNTNIKDTRKLEAQLRALSPKAGGRIHAAMEAMKLTVESGEHKDYVKSESYSDLAGRLLRKAEKDSMKTNKRQSRRRRRVTGDRYYGQSVHGGDLEISRDYQVDKRYREDILEEIQNSQGSEENQRLLERYLRQIIR
ncbi:MAG: hypothetical protein HRU09_13395 [Oligoflexales bacterium]|nr:hypothetical protein [Oligoflexales bacterium]